MLILFMCIGEYVYALLCPCAWLTKDRLPLMSNECCRDSVRFVIAVCFTVILQSTHGQGKFTKPFWHVFVLYFRVKRIVDFIMKIMSSFTSSCFKHV